MSNTNAQGGSHRTRNILIAVIALLAVAIVAAVLLIANRDNGGTDSGQSGSGGGTAIGTGPITLSKDGVGTLDDSVPTLTEYFDYSCHACADQSVLFGERLTDAAESGIINIKFQPVEQVAMGYTYPATDASLLVAANDPAHWVDFHHAMLEYFSTDFNANNGDVIQDKAKSLEVIKGIADGLGIDQSIIDQFSVDGADAYLSTATTAFQEADYEGRSGIYTPDYVANDKVSVSMDVSTVDELFDNIGEALGVTIP